MEKGNKGWRFVILLVVLALCLAFLRPTIAWYFKTSGEAQRLALMSLEKIKEYSNEQAAKDVKALEQAAVANPDAEPGEDYAWLVKQAKKKLQGFQKACSRKIHSRRDFEFVQFWAECRHERRKARCGFFGSSPAFGFVPGTLPRKSFGGQKELYQFGETRT